MKLFDSLSGHQLMVRSVCALIVTLTVSNVAFGHPALDRLDSGLSSKSRSQLEAIHELSRKKRSERSDTFRDSYQYVYDFVVEVTNELDTKLKAEALNGELKDIDVVTKIIKPTDPELNGAYDPEIVIKRILIVSDILQVIIDNLEKFIKDDEQSWWQEKKFYLEIFTPMLVNNLAPIRLEATEKGIVVVQGGLGSINRGTNTVLDSSLLTTVINVTTALSGNK